jgi:integrase
VLDNEARAKKGQRRALIAMLTFAGLRIGEALALRWGDVDLARGTITVTAAKTDAGIRTVNMVGVLRDELAAYAAHARHDANSLVFGTSTGAMLSATNVRERVLAKAIEKANEPLSTDEDRNPLDEPGELISTKLTPHSLRRTFASILFAIGETPPYVMSQMGHTTASLTLGIYARQMNRRDGEAEKLRVLVEAVNRPSRGRVWQRNGSEAQKSGRGAELILKACGINPSVSGRESRVELVGLEPTTSCMPCKRSPS